jgi:hypothetical protein
MSGSQRWRLFLAVIRGESMRAQGPNRHGIAGRYIEQSSHSGHKISIFSLPPSWATIRPITSSPSLLVPGVLSPILLLLNRSGHSGY